MLHPKLQKVRFRDPRGGYVKIKHGRVPQFPDMPKPWNKVFGIGLSRTGTMSLTQALETLGYKTVHYPKDLSVIDKVDAATDSTVAIEFRELDRKYPGSAFILTVRKMDRWLNSMKWLMGRESMATEENKKFIYAMRKRLYGIAEFDAQKLKEGYFQHMEEVLDHFRRRMGDLLVIDICAGEGWQKLAPFLGKPIPEIPFPWLNRVYSP